MKPSPTAFWAPGISYVAVLMGARKIPFVLSGLVAQATYGIPAVVAGAETPPENSVFEIAVDATHQPEVEALLASVGANKSGTLFGFKMVPVDKRGHEIESLRFVSPGYPMNFKTIVARAERMNVGGLEVAVEHPLDIVNGHERSALADFRGSVGLLAKPRAPRYDLTRADIGQAGIASLKLVSAIQRLSRSMDPTDIVTAFFAYAAGGALVDIHELSNGGYCITKYNTASFDQRAELSDPSAFQAAVEIVPPIRGDGGPFLLEPTVMGRMMTEALIRFHASSYTVHTALDAVRDKDRVHLHALQEYAARFERRAAEEGSPLAVKLRESGITAIRVAVVAGLQHYDVSRDRPTRTDAADAIAQRDLILDAIQADSAANDTLS